MQTERILVFVSGIALILLHGKTALTIAQYYISPKKDFSSEGTPSLLNILILDMGISISLAAFVSGRAGELYKGIPLPENLIELSWLVFKIAVTEEAIFRGIPGIVLLLARRIYKTQLPELAVTLGIISSLLFGAVHVTNYTQVTWVTGLAILPQIFGGLILWYTFERKGLEHAIALHFAFNLILMGIVRLAS